MHSKSKRRKKHQQQSLISEEEFFIKRTTKGRAKHIERQIHRRVKEVENLQKQLNNLTGRMVKVG